VAEEAWRRRREGERKTTQRRMARVDTALAAVNLEADWLEDGEAWQWGRVTFVYDEDEKRWESTVGNSRRKVKEREMKDEVELHRVMKEIGLRCGERGAKRGQWVDRCK
jgi:hypothetical protein